MTPAHNYEMNGYHRNPYEALLGEMEGTLVKVSHKLHVKANSYGDRPMYFEERDPEDNRLFNDTTWFHKNLDTSNTAKNANPKQFASQAE